jgi:GT2 family glycosyltransferase
VAAPVVSVVVVSYNTAELTCAAVRSAHRSAGHVPIEVLVVDNGSTDGSLDALAHLAGELALHVDAAGRNLGFGPAVNRACARARAPYVLLLNPDAELVGDALPALVDAARRHPRHGFYTGVTERSDGSVNTATVRRLPSLHSHIAFGTLASTVLPGRPWSDPEHVDVPPGEEEVPVEVATASLLLVDRSVFEELGGFDERFFLYSEETDLFRRARLHGYGPLLVTGVRFRHDAGRSTGDEGRRQALIMAGRVTYDTVAWTGWRRRLALAMLDSGVALRAAAERVRGGPHVWRAVWAARSWWRQGWLADRPGPLHGLPM